MYVLKAITFSRSPNLQDVSALIWLGPQRVMSVVSRKGLK